MYSPLYYYFCIRSNESLSEHRSVDEVREYLNRFPEITEINKISFKNRESFPWISITLINATSYDSWSSNEQIKTVNLISVTASKAENREKYTQLMEKIADYLNWEVIEEETEDGIEDFVIYKPSPNSRGSYFHTL